MSDPLPDWFLPVLGALLVTFVTLFLTFLSLYLVQVEKDKCQLNQQTSLKK